MKKPDVTAEDRARRLTGHLNRMAEQKLAAEAKKKRREASHAKRMEEQQAARARKLARVTEHKERMAKMKADADLKRGSPKESARTIIAAYRQEVNNTLDLSTENEKEDLKVFLMSIPEHYRGRASGPRWTAKPPEGRAKEWYYKKCSGDVEELETCEDLVTHLCLQYNACNHRLSVYFHEKTGFVSGGQAVGEAKKRREGKVKESVKSASKTLKERELQEGRRAFEREIRDIL